MFGARRTLLVTVATVVVAAAPGFAADEPGPVLGGLAAPGFGYDGPREGFGRRFTERFARALERGRRGARVLGPEAVLTTVTARRDAGDDVEPVMAALAGRVDPDTAAAARQVLKVDLLALGGITSDATVAVAELWDLRGPYRLARLQVSGANLGELLPRADELAAALLPAWPLEAPVKVEGGRFHLALGGNHGVRLGQRVWLLVDVARDEQGRFTHAVAIGRLIDVTPDEALGELETVLPEADPATARVGLVVER